MGSLLNGAGNLERHFMIASDGKPVEGIALRLFNPATKLWSIYWADSRSCVLDIPVVGSFENNVGYFYAKDNFNGIPVLLQFKWDATNPMEPGIFCRRWKNLGMELVHVFFKTNEITP